VSLGGGANPAAVQFSLDYPSAVNYEASSTGSAASNAGKSVTCTGIGGQTTCVVFGLNTNTMSNGVVATIGFRIQPGTTATSAAIGMGGESASDAGGTGLTVNGSGNTITINQPLPVNQAPVASGASVSTNEDTALPITLSASDPDGNPLTYQIQSQPTKGSLSGGTGSGRTYTPNANATGADSFTFRANDGALNSNTVTVNINIIAVNDAPTAQNQSVSTAQNTAKAITLAGTDVEGSNLTYSIVTGPTHGTVSGGSGAARTYTPANGYSGPDSFTFRSNDGSLNSNTATVSITVTAAANNAPTATGASVSTNEDTALPVNLTANDTDGNPLTYAIVSAPSKGSLSGGTGAGRTYTPNANATGSDSFTFRANDGTVNSNTATVNITINAVNDAPTAQNQSVSTAQNAAKAITLAGSDIEGSSLTYAIVTGPTHGTVSGGSGAARTYTPANGYSGPDSFTFRSNDGSLNSNTATVSITVTAGANNAPTATGASVSTNEDTALPVSLTANDTDGNPLTYAIVSAPSKGSLSGGTGAGRTYTPNANATGADSFTFRANDGTVNSNTATVNITINAVNDAPTAQNQSVSTAQNTAKGITLFGSDVEGGNLTYAIVTGPAHGTVSPGSGAGRTYTPANGYSGPDSFTFRVNDGSLNSSPATVSITVTAESNNPPTATGASMSTNEDTPRMITMSASDADNDPITFQVKSGPSKGSLSGTGSQRMYTPNTDYNGPDSYVFEVTDDKGAKASATINLTIMPVNDAPKAQNQTVSTQKNKALAVKVAGTDVDGDTLAYSMLGGAAHGVVSGTPPNLIYTPAQNYTGSDSFRFRVNDNKGGTADGTVNVNVATGANSSPGAGNPKVKTPKDKAVSITLTGNDPDGDTLTYSVTSAPTKGALTGNPPNLLYAPNNGYVGLDSFKYQVRDPEGATAIGTVDIEITEVDSDSVSLTSLTCSGNTITGGGSRTCSVFLNKRAPAGGVRVSLACQSKQLSLPDSVRVGPRENSARFKIQSSLIETSETVALTAALGNAVPQTSPGQVAAGNTATTQLSLIPLQPTELSCVPVQITAGRAFTCRARLNSSSFLEPVSLAVSSSTGDVKVPNTLSLRPGNSSASFRASSIESAKQQSATVVVGLNGSKATSTVSIVTGQGPTINVETPQVISVGKKLTFVVTARDPNDLPVTLSASGLPPGANFDANSGRMTWTPTAAQVGTHLVTFKARNTADAVSQKVVTIDAIVGTMKIYSFTNSASSRGDFPCSPGSLATVWGVGFTDGSGERARSFPLPTRLNGVRVDVSSRSARLLYVGDKQINLQCPMLPAGEQLSITVERTDTGATATWNAPGVSMKAASPAIFSLDGSGTGQGLAIIANSSKVAMFPTPEFDGQAAEPGDHLVIYANGLGLVDNEVALGEPAASSPLSQVLATVRVRVGDVLLPVTFAGLAPDTAGVYQVNLVLTDNVPTGPEVPLSLEVQLPDGTMVQSNVVTIAIQDGAPRFGE
jgi:uncharacterized protein (TIGR03437 family)